MNSDKSAQNWRKDNPSLTEVAEAFDGMRELGEARLFYLGSFIDIVDGKMYVTQGDIMLFDVLPDENQLTVALIDDFSRVYAEWFVEAIFPCSFQITIDPSYPYNIYNTNQSEWPSHVEIQAFMLRGPEAITRDDLINPVLSQKGWDRKIEEEYRFRSELTSRNYQIDYLLFALDANDQNEQPIALVEAKHDGLAADHGLGQGRMYADLIQQQVRFVYSTNGREFVCYDRLVGEISAPRPMNEFPTYVELSNLYFRGSRNIDKPLENIMLPQRQAKVDPSREEDARAVIESLLPESSRIACLTFLAESIQFAHRLNQSKWQVTLGLRGRYRYIRLNVGPLEVCAIFPGIMHLVLDDDNLKNRFELELQAIIEGPTVYKNVPSSTICEIGADEFSECKPLFIEAYLSLIDKASQKGPKRSRWYLSHSKGVIEYLRQITKLELPDPVY